MPLSADELYNVYRQGLVTRHITLNGRVDQYVWLTDQPSDPNYMPNNRRKQEETWCDPSLVQQQAYLEWVPLSFPATFPDGKLTLGNSMGYGDNALLTNGYALALFSLEVLHGVNPDSEKYADLLFDFICKSEIKGHGGCFLRKHSTEDKVRLASTDDVLGICVGLTYYWQMVCWKNETDKIDQVRQLVSRFANTLAAHGCWILPFSSDLDGYLQGQDDAGLGSQVGWVFAYALNQFCKTICGTSVGVDWNDDELDFYSSDSFASTKYQALISLVRNVAPPSWEEWLLHLATGDIPGLVFQEVKSYNLDFQSDTFFKNLLKIVEMSFDPGDPSAIVLNVLIDFLLPVLGQIITDAIVDGVTQPKTFFNINLVALASVIALENGADQSVCCYMKNAFATVVKTAEGSGNAFFSLISRKCGDTSDETAAALDILTVGFQEGNAGPSFSPNLPLNLRGFINVGGTVLGQVLFNLEGYWGNEWTWQCVNRSHTTDRHDSEYRYMGNVTAFLDSSACSLGTMVALETCGLDLLLPRMLAQNWSLIEKPAIPNSTPPVCPFPGVEPIRDSYWFTYDNHELLPQYAYTGSTDDFANPQRILQSFHIKGGQKYVCRWGTENPELPPDSGTFGAFEVFSSGLVKKAQFAGRRNYKYQSRQLAVGHQMNPYYANEIQVQFYLELSSEQDALQGTPVWSPGRSDPKVLQGSLVEDTANILPFLDSSKCYGCVHVSVSTPCSAGAEDRLQWRSPIFSVGWLGFNYVPASPKYNFVYNPHQGVVHRLNGDQRHFYKMFHCYNAILLPVTNIDKTWTETQILALLNTLGLPWPYPNRYYGVRFNTPQFSTNSAETAFWKKNTRTVKLCQQCFK